MSSTDYQESIWKRQEENDEKAPKYCPHCGEKLAHPDNLRENDDVKAVGRGSAYRKHRQAHYSWGIDPEGYDGDPYLADYYDGVEQDKGPTLDPDEEVAGVYDVEINYEAVLRAKVVASDKGQARERAKDLRLDKEECVGGWVPETEITHAMHETAREIKRLTRGEIEETSEVDEEEDSGVNYADRLPGWPW